MKWLLAVLSLPFLAWGIFVMLSADSNIHEIYSALNILTAITCWGFAGVIHAIDNN